MKNLIIPFFPPLLIILNLILFIKLKLLIPQLTGNAHLPDFENYLRLIDDIKEGINPYTVSYMQTLGPPMVFFYFLPFSVFNLQSAKFLYTLINIICGFATCRLLAKKLFRKNTVNWFLFLNLIFFSSFPVRFSIEMGQPNLVIGYLVSLLICNTKNKWAHIFMSLLIIIKTNYLITLTSLIRKDLKQAIKTILTILLVSIFLLPIINPSYYSYYFSNRNRNFLPVLTNNLSLDYYNQSVPARLNTMRFGETSIPLYMIAAAVILVILYQSQNLLLGFIASIILSPTSWQHYFAVLFPIFIIAFLKTKKLFNKRILLTAFFFWWAEFPLLHFAKANFFSELLSSHYLISAIILFAAIYTNKINIRPASK